MLDLDQIPKVAINEAIEIMDNLFAIRLPRHRLRYGQCYALRRPKTKEVLLVDAVQKEAQATLKRLIKGYTVRALLLTHRDLIDQAYDSLSQIGKDLGDCPVLAHSMDIGNVPGILPLETNRPLLKEIGVKYFHVPGHTPGSCAFKVAPEKILFVGDCLVGDVYEGEPQGITHPPISEDDWAAYRDGWAHVTQNDVRLVAPLHGRPHRDVSGAIGAAMRKQNLTQLP